MWKITALLIFSCHAICQQQVSKSWQDFADEFEIKYKQFHIPTFQISYVENLKSIPVLENVLNQKLFFNSIKQQLRKFNSDEFNSSQKLDYLIIDYETSLNIERTELELDWLKTDHPNISEGGLSGIKNGQKWYAYFLKKWNDKNVTPDKMYHFGLKEIAKVESEIQSIKSKLKMSDYEFDKHISNQSFFLNSSDDIRNEFLAIDKKINGILDSSFPYLDKTPRVKILQGSNERLSMVPAYYQNDTFYFNYFDKPFNKRQLTFLYLHEAIPGHHYQFNIADTIPRSDIRNLFTYNGYLEGYAAYVEDIGFEINAYQDIYQELGKWEWDIIRSVRVVLDVGLNYYGWSDKKALIFWKGHITGQDDIAKREIARMKKWPAQVVSYKYGADRIMQWKTSKNNDASFSLKQFHTSILKYGPLPFSVLEKFVLN